MMKTHDNSQPIPTVLVSPAERWEPIFFWFLCFVNLLPLWLFQWFPSQDGPIHLSIADMIMKFHDPKFAIFHEFFQLRMVLEPNLLIYGIILLLLRVTDIAVAEKLLLTLYAIGFPLAARYAITAVNPQGKVFSLFFLPFVMGRFIHYGFYNFCFSFALFLVSFGYWWRHRYRLSLHKCVVIGILGFLTTLAHLMGFVVLTLAVALTRTGDLLIDGIRSKRRSPWRCLLLEYLKDAFSLLVVYLPALTVVVSFFLRYPIQKGNLVAQTHLILQFGALSPVYSSKVEAVFSLPLIILVWSLCIMLCLRKADNRRLDQDDSLLFGFLGLCLIYFLFPGSVRDVSASQRLLPFLLFLLFLWFASNLFGPLLSRVVTTIVLLVSLTTVGYRIYVYNRLNDFMSEYLSVTQQIAPHTSLLALHFRRYFDGEPFISLVADPFLHLSSTVARERGGVDLRSAIMSRHRYGYFPIVYRRDRDPYVYIGEKLERTPPIARFTDYRQRTGGPLDYVLTWRLEDANQDDPNVRSVMSQLQEGFRLIYVSPQRGLAKLWMRNTP
jgi:hypothetical protein